MSIRHAMLLAAGRGERLQPLTDRIPKPLIEIDGKPLIVHHIERLAAAGMTDIVVNLAWLGEQIVDALGNGDSLGVNIEYSREPEGALETAGGIVEALPLLGSDPFVVVSADVWTDYPFARLAASGPESPAHLVLVDNPGHHPAGDFALDGARVVPLEAHGLTYSGIGRFHPEFFRALAPGRRALRPVLDAAITEGSVSGEHYRGRWADIGTPQRLAEAQQSLSSSP